MIIQGQVTRFLAEDTARFRTIADEVRMTPG